MPNTAKKGQVPEISQAMGYRGKATYVVLLKEPSNEMMPSAILLYP